MECGMKEKFEGEFNVHSPTYDGPDRRLHCNCHLKHDKAIQDNTEEIKELRRDAKARDKDADTAHGKLWGSIDILTREKVEKRLFYILIASVFAVMGFVYKGIHEVDKSMAVLNNNMQQHLRQAVKIENQIQRVEEKVEAHIHQTENRHTNHGGS
jgi:hypothetical protein